VRENAKTELSLDYAFKYFDLHAKQRMTVFNFFLVIAGILTGGIAAALTKTPSMPVLGAALSLVLILISFVFWKLDLRTSFLIKHSEQALIECEKAFLLEKARLISNEKACFAEFQSKQHPGDKAWSYSKCFETVFVAMTLLGVLGLGLSISNVWK
jgi:hypothetical protein